LITRAFELARSGTYKTNDEIKRQLAREGYSGITDHFQGASLRKQLLALMKAPSLKD
jgi:hypothetical protein